MSKGEVVRVDPRPVTSTPRTIAVLSGDEECWGGVACDRRRPAEGAATVEEIRRAVCGRMPRARLPMGNILLRLAGDPQGMSSIQKSVRLPDELARMVRSWAEERGRPFSEVLRELLEEAVKMRRCPGIVFADGPSGRRARVAGTGLEV